jgi:aspartyl-tRNA(Asn)/glutamyl-tRNA(Gln) amidotransferase subunit C
MSKLSKEDILKLARLARLRLTEEEVALYQKELSAILSYVEQLDAVDVAGLEPTYQVTGLTNVTRPDVVAEYGMSQHDLLKNVPEKEDAYIKVRRMLA